MRRVTIKVPKNECNKKWKRWIKANCYLYAINYQSNTDGSDPGDIAGLPSLSNFASNEEIFKRIKKDLKTQGICVRKCKYNYQCKSNEWKIALMVGKDEEFHEYDYHFLREDKVQRWSHKFRNTLPRKTDDFGQTIRDPREAEIEMNMGVFYEFQMFLVLEKKGKS